MLLLCGCSGTVPYGWTLADWLVFRTVRSALGFDRCRMCLTAAAPIMKDTLDFFMSLNLPLMEIYGMSETSGQLLQRLVIYNNDNNRNIMQIELVGHHLRR